MSRVHELSAAAIEEYDRIYREAGLRAMAPVYIRYDNPLCPHPGCGQKMEWIAFNLESSRDPQSPAEPLIRAWWEGRGFAGRCPTCRGWIRFTTRQKEAIEADAAARMERLPEDWHTVARLI